MSTHEFVRNYWSNVKCPNKSKWPRLSKGLGGLWNSNRQSLSNINGRLFIHPASERAVKFTEITTICRYNSPVSLTQSHIFIFIYINFITTCRSNTNGTNCGTYQIGLSLRSLYLWTFSRIKINARIRISELLTICSTQRHVMF